MNAYFSGRLNNPDIRIELTYGEETDMEGAYAVMETLQPNDAVTVVDVTGTITQSDITIEKCSDLDLKGLSHMHYVGCLLTSMRDAQILWQTRMSATCTERN